MPDALTIDFALTGFAKVQKAFTTMAALSSAAEKRLNALESSVSGAASAYAGLNAQVALFNRLSGSGGGGGTASPGGAGRGGGSRGPSYVQGPFQRQIKLAQQLQSAMGSNNLTAAADIRLAQFRNNKQIAQVTAGPKSFGDKLKDVISTSRIGFGGGKAELMPLVGKVAGLAGEALGPELLAFAGPVGIAAAAAIEAGKAVFELARNAVAAGAAFSSFQFSVGNFGPASSQALALGRAGGLDAGAVAGQAGALQEGITGSALGRAIGEKYGVFNVGGYYGNQDTASQYVTFMRNLKASGASLQEKIRDARAAGVSGSLSELLTSKRQDSYQSGDAATHGKIFDADFATKSADFNAALARVSDAASNLMTALGKPFLDALTTFFNGLASAMNGLASFINSPVGQGLMAALSPLAALGSLGGGVGAGGADTTAQAQLKATQDNTAAVMDNSKRLDGTYGVDSDGRLAGAMPGAGRPSSVGFDRNKNRQELAGGAYRLAAF